eukprot:g101.t1
MRHVIPSLSAAFVVARGIAGPDDAAYPHFLPEEDFPDAKCLDGSRPLYYYRPGFGSGKDSWLLYHEGQGFCGSSESCLARSKTAYGSSHYEKENYGSGKSRLRIRRDGSMILEKSTPHSGGTATDAAGHQQHSLLSSLAAKTQGDSHDSPPYLLNITAQNAAFSRDATLNPLLHNWNHVFLRYCDGGYVSGDRRDPVEVVDPTGNGTEKKQLWYRGKYITEGVFAHLAQNEFLVHPFRGATDVILSGSSSGGIRTLLHMERLRALLLEQLFPTPKTSTRSIPPEQEPRISAFIDSGFYLDNEVYRPPKKWLVDNMGVLPMLNGECVAAHPAAPETCMVSSVAAAYVRSVPIFAVQSRYDTDQREDELSEDCAASEACVTQYGDLLTGAFKQWVYNDAKNGQPRGGLLDSCSHHCIEDAADLAFGERYGENALQMLARWYRAVVPGTAAFADADKHGGVVVVFDSQESARFPCEKCCHGKPATGHGNGAGEEGSVEEERQKEYFYV